jgi:hypothetical protein
MILISLAVSGYFAQAESRKKILMWSGIASLVVMLTGFGMAGVQKIGFPLWINVKILCWLLISSLVGVYFRKPELKGKLLVFNLVLAFVALSMVYWFRFNA